MLSHDGENNSIWMITAQAPPHPKLTQDTTADVCVIGGGIAGLSTAYLLSREGQSVIVLDKPHATKLYGRW
jgi:cation diffusion facilitator CzcD-associated flavoprotein CzcO